MDGSGPTEAHSAIVEQSYKRGPGDPGWDLDPRDDHGWERLASMGRMMVDDMIAHLRGISDGPAWSPMSADTRNALAAPLETMAPGVDAAYADFRQLILPHSSGNTHPSFMGWAQGGGTIEGMLAEMLAGGLNANVGGRDHAAIDVERQVVAWTAKLLGMPLETSGILLTGTSMANLCAILVARTALFGAASRNDGLAGRTAVAYTSEAAHGCVGRAMDFAGFGRAALRLIPCTPDGRMDPAALAAAMDQDAAAGLPALAVVGTSGTVGTGACDDLAAIGTIARAHKTWFHVDAAIGGVAAAWPGTAGLLAGIGQADSIATDLHKWGQAPYDCGCLLVRNPDLHRATFSHDGGYLARGKRGIAIGETWPCDLGPDLSRRFRALGAWFTIRTHGVAGMARTIETGTTLARRMEARAHAEPELEVMAPAGLCIACFRYAAAPPADLDALNMAIVEDLQQSGEAVPSLVRIGGRVAIRTAIMNHRTTAAHVDAVIEAVLRQGRARCGHPIDGPAATVVASRE